MGSQEKMSEYKKKNAERTVARSSGDVCRDRISLLLDADSFVELDSRVEARGLKFGFSRPAVAGDGVVTGYGTIDNRLVYIAAQDPAVFGGSIGQMHAGKICKALDLAVAARVPFIGLYDCGGARIEEGIVGLEGLAGVLASLDATSGEIPLIAAICGPVAGGAAFAAAASDFVLMHEKGSGLFMNGPMVVAAKAGQSLDASAIGGAKVHAVQTGLASLTAPDEMGMFAQLKNLMHILPDSSDGYSNPVVPTDDPNRSAARLDEIAANLDTGYSMREIITEIVDTGSFLELSAAFAPGLLTGLARLDGQVVGILANAAPRMDAAQTDKGIRLLALCDRFALPLITLTDAEGYVISLEAEKSGLIQAGASLMQAVLRLAVPRIGVIVGKAIGTAYLTLNSKSCGTDIVYAWPTAEIAVVMPDTAAHIIYRQEIAAAADPANARNEFVQRYADEIASPYVAASLGHVDEVIQPSATRPRVISALNMLTIAY